MNTRERLLSAAITLFNEKGTAQVSTNHIAHAAGVSPGNLYYHFRNKEAIIRAICETLFAQTSAMFTPAADRLPTLDDVQRWVTENFQVTWQYAFVYRELPALIRHDPELAALYRAARSRGYADFRALVLALKAAGVLNDSVDEALITQLADLLWLLSESWLTALELQGAPAGDDAMQRGTALMLLILQPYLT